MQSKKKLDLLQAVPENVDSEAQEESARRLAIEQFRLEDIQVMSTENLKAMQKLLQHGDSVGTWETPLEWFPSSIRFESNAHIDLRERIVSYLPPLLNSLGEQSSSNATSLLWLEKDIDRSVLLLTRYLLLLRVGPGGLGRKGSNSPLKAGSLAQKVGNIAGPAMFAVGIIKRHKDALRYAQEGLSDPRENDGVLLRKITSTSDFVALGKHLQDALPKQCRRMQMLSDRGLWADLPALQLIDKSEAMLGPRAFNEEDEPIDKALPLPDDYVALMGQRSLWLTRDLCPNLLVLGQELVNLWKETSEKGHAPNTVKAYRDTGVQEILARHTWVDHKGNPFDRPPFELLFAKDGGLLKIIREKAGKQIQNGSVWPPTGFKDIVWLFGAAQLAHYFIIALSMGARQSEALDLKRDALGVDKHGRAVVHGKEYEFAKGKTRKLEARNTGRVREWLLTEIPVEAFKQQAQLVALWEQMGPVKPTGVERQTSNQLFVRMTSNQGTGVPHVSHALRSFAKTIGMETEPGGQPLRSHRLRKTLARLVALALTQAPKLLMDIFGHKSIEMTLYYILTDKELRAEIKIVERELRVMRAKEVVERMVDAEMLAQSEPSTDKLAGYGGLAATKIQAAVHSDMEKVHRTGETYGAKHGAELARILTYQGNAWEQVRHGVMCTKVPGQAGACSKKVGHPEPSKCGSTCDYRLEEAFLKSDVDLCIQGAVSDYEKALGQGEDGELVVAFAAGQIRVHLPRFAELQEKWMVHPTVKAAMAEVAA